MTSTITPPDAGGAVTFAGSSVTSYCAPISRRPSSVTPPSIQQSVTHEDLEAAVDRRLLLHAPARPEKVPVVALKSFNGQQSKWISFNRSINTTLELPGYSPGGNLDLITTPTNQAASIRVRNVILTALEGGVNGAVEVDPFRLLTVEAFQCDYWNFLWTSWGVEEEPAVDGGVDIFVRDGLLDGGTGDAAGPTGGWRTVGGY